MPRLLLTVLAVVLIALVPTVAAAQVPGEPPNDVIIGGMGSSSCGRWTTVRRERSEGHAWGYEQWLLGYISGVAVGNGHPDVFNPLSGTDLDGVWAWVDNYCRTNPLRLLVEAAGAFGRAHPHQ